MPQKLTNIQNNAEIQSLFYAEHAVRHWHPRSSPQVVMKWTGHSDYQAMKLYIEIAEKTKADAMKLFEQEMEK